MPEKRTEGCAWEIEGRNRGDLSVVTVQTAGSVGTSFRK